MKRTCPTSANADAPPTCWIIGGPNGAGKTTFALHYLPKFAGCLNFANVDLIASGLAPLSPQSRNLEASRIFLREISLHVAHRSDFGFETTLAGLANQQLISRLKADGHAERISQALEEAVAEALERKRKLGQYAVF